jgi:Spy/CpxP family protein refolding chaperone
MRYHSLTAVAVVLATSMAVFAQAPQPYAGMQSRPIKALSDQQTSDLKSGRGMGLALAAELNGYPGPSHVLELADQLGLTVPQRKSVQQLFNAMKAETIPLGEQLLIKEADLDQQFAAHVVTPASLKTATSAIGQTQGQLREAHLRYHLATAALLMPEQMQRYGELRGYSKDAGDHGQHHSN